ncbi:GNAT family N-acetyltransferase [Lysinimonas soli]|uniref:GNAT family N-acetyltransferase n=1 Tax=Lysinimonas soli TaxID=1074233 RepID=A0ABW0NMT3_9MICO
MTGSPRSADFTTAPADPTSRARLAERGLRYALVDTDDPTAFADWLRADDRGFHLATRDDEKYERGRAGIGYRRTTGVYDDGLSVDPQIPVATVGSWRGELTVPGSTVEHPSTLAAWAISSVTVASTHRRRGIARNLLEGELRTAASLGVPMAMLTVSESTIYGRFGFAPAAFATNWTIDTRRAKWNGPAVPGAVEFVGIERFRLEAAELHERVRLTTPGDIDLWGHHWDQQVGATDPDEARTKQLRAVRYRDAEGVTRGLALYRVTGGEPDFSQHVVEVDRLISETPDAASALWRYLLELDLVTEVRAQLRPVDEVLRWQIADYRAAKVETWEHQYLRVLDVPTAFAARSYAAPGRLALEVTDPLGFAAGSWLLTVSDDGAGAVTTASAVDGVPALRLTVNELAALYLGGVAATTLVDAGRVVEGTVGAASAADRMLRTARAPWLSVWY